MEHDNLKKDSDITAFDELTDEQLEAVLGGYVKGGKTYTTTFAASGVNIQSMFVGKFDPGTGAGVGGATSIAVSTGTTIGIDASGTTVYTKD